MDVQLFFERMNNLASIAEVAESRDESFAGKKKPW